MPWLQRYVVGGFKVYAAVTIFFAIFFLCRKDSTRTLDHVLFQEDGLAAIVFTHFCILLTAMLLHAVGRIIFGRLLVREWSNGGFTEQLNSWIAYRLVFLLGVLDITSMRPFLWWCWWFVIILYLRFFLMVSRKRLKILQTQENADLHDYNKRIYRVQLFCMAVTFGAFITMWISISTAFGNAEQEYLFRTLTNPDDALPPEEAFITQRKHPSKIIRIFYNTKFIFNKIFDLMGLEDHEAKLGPRVERYLENKIEKKIDKFKESSESPRFQYDDEVGNQAVAHEIIGLIQAILFTLGETSLLFIEAMHMFLKHGVFILDEKFGLERRRTFYFTHWCTYIYEASFYLVSCIHSMHLLYCVNFISLTALFWFYQLRTNWHSLCQSRQKHRRFIFMRRKMRQTYKPLTLEELRSGDTCPICWESYDKTCRVLPCTHIFHVHCIQQWFEQESTCPTCRYNLQADIHASQEPNHNATRTNTPDANNNNQDPPSTDDNDPTSTDSPSHSEQEDAQLLTNTADENNGEPTRITGRFLGMRFGISYQFGGRRENNNVRRRRQGTNSAPQTPLENPDGAGIPAPPRQRGSVHLPTPMQNLEDWLSDEDLERVMEGRDPGGGGDAEDSEGVTLLPTAVQEVAQNFVNALIGNDEDNLLREAGVEISEDMIEQVMEVLPHFSREEVTATLRRTGGSVTNSINELLGQ